MSAWNLFKTIIWWIFGGLEAAIAYAFAGILWCVSIVGIPFGLQLFKLAVVNLFPFDAQISKPKAGPIGCVGNVIWVLFFGWEIALVHILFGLLLFITIIGIPWGKMQFDMVPISFAPFGRDVRVFE